MAKPRIPARMRGFLLPFLLLAGCTPLLRLTTYVDDLQLTGVQRQGAEISVAVTTGRDLRRLMVEDRLMLLHARVSRCASDEVLASGTIHDDAGEVSRPGTGPAITAGEPPFRYDVRFASPQGGGDLCIRLIGYPDGGLRTGAATNTVRLPAATLSTLSGG